jgi:hypothetical protein
VRHARIRRVKRFASEGIVVLAIVALVVLRVAGHDWDWAWAAACVILAFGRLTLWLTTGGADDEDDEPDPWDDDGRPEVTYRTPPDYVPGR